MMRVEPEWLRDDLIELQLDIERRLATREPGAVAFVFVVCVVADLCAFKPKTPPPKNWAPPGE